MKFDIDNTKFATFDRSANTEDCAVPTVAPEYQFVPDHVRTSPAFAMLVLTSYKVSILICDTLANTREVVKYKLPPSAKFVVVKFDIDNTKFATFDRSATIEEFATFDCSANTVDKEIFATFDLSANTVEFDTAASVAKFAIFA